MPNTHHDGARIAYLAEGAGEPVVLLHSSACSASQWRGLVATLAGRFRVIAPDLTGYGGSDPWRGDAGRRPLCLVDEVALVEAVVADDLGADYDGPLHLVGHSYGGAVALAMALRRARRPGVRQPRSLTLIEPVAFHLLWNSDPEGLGSFAELRRLADDVTLALAEAAPERAMHRFVDYWNGPGTWSRLEPEQRARLVRVAPKLAQDFFAAFAEPTTLADLAEVAAPTLLLCGGCSPEPMRRLFALLAAAIPASEGVMLKGAGHMAPLTHGEAVNAAVARHLDDHAVRRPIAA